MHFVRKKENKNFFSKREELSKHISDLDKDSFRLSAQLEKLQETMNNQANYMWEEYGVTVESAKEFRDENLPTYTGIRKEIGDIKGTVTCPVCKASNPADADYCAKCGEKIN